MVTIRKPKNALKFSLPAGWWGSTWREALPTGNGVMGASVTGGAANEVIMLTHSDNWWQGGVGVLQDVADKVPSVRKKMDDGDAIGAQDVLKNALITKNYRPTLSYPLPVCDFHVDMKLDRAAKEYSRVLNMENGEISVSFKDGATRYDRSMFVSRAQNMLVYEITRTGSKAIDVKFSLDLHDRFNVRTPDAVSKLPEGVNVKYEKFFMCFSARSDSGAEFGAVGFINHYGGEQIVETSGITIRGAERVLVIMRPFVESQREKEWKAIKESLKAVKSTYEKLLKEHTPLHNKLFNSAELDLDAENRELCTDDLIKKAFTDGEVSLALVEKLWAYGRYLMICGSSSASHPLPPYGLWCGDYKAPNSQINAAGSLQTTYSHVLSGNLADQLLSVFTYYESVLDDLKKSASRLYGCRGIFIPAVTAHGTGVPGTVDSGVLHFTGVAGWIAHLFYDYALYTDDAKFLKMRALPFMKEVALFYENFFKVNAQGKYDACPSYSPDTTPGNYSNGGIDTLQIARDATVDFAIAKELFTDLVEGSERAGINKSDIPKWKDMLTRIPDYRLNEDGTVREYLDAAFSDNYASASTSMFYPVYQSGEITPSSELYKAFYNTAKKKLSGASADHTSMSLSRYASLFAAFGDGDTALELISTLTRTMAMNNLVFSATDWRGMGAGGNGKWAQYTVESNMGVTAALQDMFVQSDAKTIRLLPALPSSFLKGQIDGMQTRTGVEVTSLVWDKRKGLVSVKLKSRRACTIDLKLPQGAKRFKQIGSEKIDYESGTVTGLDLTAGKVTVLDIRL
ncbi:MAG: glycoside hydrolase family 95 protein [Clostridiales bacterium]|nr:glycoside hydrolase family 95 protein [Clostridiales bacterium]